MKWEILKGSEGDFSGAPKWATLVVESREHGRLSWEESSFPINGKRYQWIDDGIEEKYEVTDESIRFNIIAERRPITEPDVNQQLTDEWSGEGLPPVGVRCEHLGGGENEWMTVTVIAISERPDSSFTDYWLRTDSGANFIIGNPYRFRPIRSPEDVARHNALYALESLNIDSDITIKILDAISAGKIPGVKLE